MKQLVFIITLLSAICAEAQILTCQPCFKGTMKQYEKSEWDVTLKGKWNNPYDPSQISLDMVFISPDGQKGVLPCFYIKGNSDETSAWKARFAAKQTGKYQIQFELRNKGTLISTSAKKEVESQSSSSKGFLRKGDSWMFRFDNGEPFRAIGENIGWECRDADDSKYFKSLHENPRFNYDYMIPKLANSGGNFFRTWMIYWNLPVDWKTVTNNHRYTSTSAFYNNSGMERLDHLLHLCDSLGVYIMLALESHVGYMGDGWNTSSYHVRNGGYAATPEEFFSNQKSREQYKNKLRLMIARYGYSPSIAVWEFFNEVDHIMHDTSFGKTIPAEVITDWHREMSEYLKANDPYHHLISTSVSHRDIEGMNDLPSLDFNQRHIYGNAFTLPDVIKSYEKKHHKPYVIGECGYHWDWSLNFNEYATEFDRDFRKTLWLGLFSPTPILPMSWWWEFFEERGMMNYFSIVKKVNEEMLQSVQKGGLKEVPILVSDSLKALGVKAGDKLFGYLYNTSNKSEFAQEFTFKAEKGTYKVEAYHTLTGERSILGNISTSADNHIRIHSIKLAPQQDVVLICTRLKQMNKLKEQKQ